MKINFKKYFNSTFIILFLILLLGLFLRTYKLEIFYSFGHDQDLSAWIAKDIIIDHHIRLIGQETSILGIFVGPLFYYLMAVSFGIFNMNPLSGAAITTIIGLFAIISIYWVFNKFFGRNIGLIGSFLYTITPGTIFGDRWVVPTQPTALWSIWFLFILLSILRGNYNILIPLSILIGLIWHIHIALIPLLLLVPIAFIISDKKKNAFKYDPKTILCSIAILLILLGPFLIFELKHQGLEIKSFIAATQTNKDTYIGLSRVVKVFDASGKGAFSPFFFDDQMNRISFLFIILVQLALLFTMIFLKISKILDKRQLALLITWYIIVLLAQFLSNKPISEYYSGNLVIIVFLILSLLLNQLNHLLKKFPIASFLLLFYSFSVLTWFVAKPEGSSGFLQKKQAVEFIRNDFAAKDYPCIGINHIEPPQSAKSGFRYLFWYYGLKVIKPNSDIPVYSIVNPWTISASEINARFDDIGVILPSVKLIDPIICSLPERQLLPLWGFNN